MYYDRFRCICQFRACLLLATLLIASQAVGRTAARADGAPAKPDQHVEESVLAAPKNLEDLKAIQSQVQQVVAKVLPCTVAVRIGSSSGSGVIVSEDGFVMTAGHVAAKPNQPVTIVFADGKTAKGKTLGVFVSADAGLVQITDQGKWPFAEQGTSNRLRPGAWCLALGHPFGYQTGRPPVVRVGRLLVLRNWEAMMQTDCALVSGDSGGPLFDLEGKVIGIHSRIGGSTDQNLHVPVDIFRENWERLVHGDMWPDELYGRDSSEVKAAFRQVVAEARRCTVRIKCNQRDAALGTIVGPDGWIVSKASELGGKIVCCLPDGRELEARVVGVCKSFDLAMLKIEASGLPVIPWTKDQPAVGQWLAAPGPGEDPLAVGILSLPQRRIPPISGALGVAMKIVDEAAHAQLEKVYPNSPAEEAGLKEGDIITAVNGNAIHDAAEFIATVKQHRPGETIRLEVKRGPTMMSISVKLAILETPGTRRRDLQNRMGVGVSSRRDDFPAVLQHDTVLRPTDCGGPLVDLTGKVVGVNIARGGRTETYCVPSEVLLGLMYDLMSGRLDPKLLAQKAAAEKQAAERTAAEKRAAERTGTAQKAGEKNAGDEKASAEKAGTKKNGTPGPPANQGNRSR